MTLIYRYAAWGLAALALAGSLVGYGFIKGDDHGQGVVRAADAKAQAAVYARFEWNLKHGQELATELAAAKAKAKPIQAKDNQEISRDTHPTVAAPGAATSAPLLTAHAVCMFDRKWSGFELPGGYRAAGADSGAGDPCAAAEGASAFDVRDVLYTDAFNADVCWANTIQLEKLIEWERDRAAAAGKP